MASFDRIVLLLAVAAGIGAAAGCGGGSATDPLRGLEKANLLANPENPFDPADPKTQAKIELGKTLFFDPRLSGSGKMSCSTCHLHELGWTDGKQFSPKDDGSLNTRNTPTVYNVGYLDRLYWDGRAKTLEGNVVAAWKAQMGGKPEEVAKALNAVPGYQTLFQDAFAGPASETTIGHALASFLRSLRSADSPFDRWQAGQPDAVGNEPRLGYEVFTRAGCNVCHTPPLFTDRGFHNAGIGMDAEKPDIGAGGETAFNDPAMRGRFKTPTLRSVAKTGPWFHDGHAKTLEEAVRLMASGGKDVPGNEKDPLLQDRKLSDQEIKQLVAFLESLSSSEPFTPPKIP
jgi:cytochrome c peroxidase